MAPSKNPKTAATSTAEVDVITNRALLDYAEASRLAKSWLSGFPSANGHDDQDTDLEREAEEEAERNLLKNRDLYSETGGIGYKAPDSVDPASSTRPGATDSTTTFLRKQLLGGRGVPRVGQNGQLHNTTVARPRPQEVRRPGKQDDDSDEDESRAAVGKKRKHSAGKATKIATPGSEASCDNEEPVDIPEQHSRQVSKPRANKSRGSSSYLDELLASRAAKKQKKNKGKGNPG